MPDIQASITSQGAAQQNIDNNGKDGGSTIQDTRNLAEAFSLFSRYGDEFMDDSPLVGEPGSFILSKTNEKPASSATTTRQKSGSGGATKLPPPPPPPASTAKPTLLKIDSSVKTAGKGTEKSPITPGGTKEKVKRKKSKMGVSAGPS
jgi:mediator of RNA polymerase II transcription subunit 6